MDSLSRSRLLPLSMDSALTEGKRSLPARLPITRILRVSNTKEITQIAAKNYCFGTCTNITTWHLILGMSSSPTSCFPAHRHAHVQRDVLVRHGCATVIVHLTWAAQPTGSGWPRGRHCAIITHVSTYRHRPSMCMNSHYLRPKQLSVRAQHMLWCAKCQSDFSP